MPETTKTPRPISPMPFLKKPTLLQALKLNATLFLGLLFLPSFLFLFITFSFTFFLISPIFCFFAWALLLCKLILYLSIKYLGNLCAWIFETSSPTYVNNNIIDATEKSDHHNKVDGLKDKQISVELDPSEFPALLDSEDEEEKWDFNGREDSWQIRALKSVARAEHKSFYEILSFWKIKEKDREA